MKKAIICHGINKSKEFAAEHLLPVSTWHWLGWLQQKYNLNDVSCQNPLFPHSWFPDKTFEDDYAVFKNFVIDEDTRLIGWSAGTAFLLRYLYIHPKVKAKHLVLLSPHVNPNGILGDYFKDQLPDDLEKRFERIDVFYSVDDPVPGVLESADILIKKYPSVKVHKFEKHGHFQEQAMGTKEFPELWEVCKSMI
jgi:pimeloyl-ACP methyl ester carboxylesterase